MSESEHWAVGDLPWGTDRQRTAISRSDLSMPVRLSLGDEVLSDDATVLDYGSGRGQDVRRLQAMGIDAIGWDPYFAHRSNVEERDVVLLTYVLNVVEDPDARRATLERAWSHARRALVVSTRLVWESRKVTGESMADGVRTSRNTFQHLFRPQELRALVEEVTRRPVVAAAPGVVYCFRQDADRMLLLARRTLPTFDWHSETYAAALESAVAFAHQRGRAPTFEEIPVEVLPVLGRVSSRDISRLVSRLADPEQVARGVRQATLDTLLYLGIDLFNGRARLSSLPLEVQADVRSHFTSYREACKRADRLLLKLRDDAYIRGAMHNSVGKLTPSALYVHRRAVTRMPVVLRLYEHCGSIAAGRPEDYTLVKLSHDRRAVSWLGYPDFERDPHPRTAWSYCVSFPDFDTSYTDYRERSNRPLLHRKEEFLASDDASRAKFERLTKSEMRAGLYLNSHLIGTEDGWQSELQRCGVTLRGHRLVSSQAGK